MAEKKTHNLVAAEGEGASPQLQPAKEAGNAKGLRIGAIVLWVAAIVFEALAVLILAGKVNLKFLPLIWQLIVMIVLDLACVIVGAQLWKKANHIDPVSEANRTKFWLWNNMGVIAGVIAFVPLIVVLLSNKNLDKQTKTIATVAALVALLIGGAASVDYNPVSAEQKEAAVEALADTDVYWAPFGRVYHTHEDCGALNRSETLTYGTVEQAIAANRTRLCAFCAARDGIEGVVTDKAVEDVAGDLVDQEAAE